MGGAQFRRQHLAINKAPRPTTIEADKGQREPRWLLLITLLFVLGVTLLLVFYAQVHAFLS
jgi:hypothetical protein